MMLQILFYGGLFLIFYFLLSIYLKLVRPTKRIYDKLRSQGIQGEPFVPLIGQVKDLRRHREDGQLYEYHHSLLEKYGSIYVFCLGPYLRLAVNEPDLIAEILSRTSAQNFMKPADLSSRLKPLIGVHNLLVSNGHEHERARRMLNPAFHFNNLQSMISIMTFQTTNAIDKLVQTAAVVDLTTTFSDLTLSIIISSAFGKDSKLRGALARQFTEVLSNISYRFLRMISVIPIISQLPFWGKTIVDNGTRDISNFVDQIIADRRQGRSQSLCANEDLLDLLLSATDEQGESFTNQEIKDQALTFVLAGHETTSNLMAWVMYELMTNRSVYEACREEVDRVLPNGILPSSENLNNLQIIEAVLYETLRLYPPAPFFVRQSINAQMIGSTTNRPLYIPAGTTILFNTHEIHRLPQYWTRPNEFDYTRWLRDPTTGLKPKLAHSHCYMPFAAGPRNCIGQNFALLEAKIILAMCLQRCDFDFEPGQKIIPVFRITVSPKHGLLAKVRQRFQH